MTVVALGAVINHTSQRSCCANWLKNCSPEVDFLYCMWKSLKRGLEEQFSSDIWPIIGFHVGFPSVPVSALKSTAKDTPGQYVIERSSVIATASFIEARLKTVKFLFDIFVCLFVCVCVFFSHAFLMFATGWSGWQLW